MKRLYLLRANLKAVFCHPLPIILYTAACLGAFLAVTLIGRSDISGQMLPGVTGSAAMNLACGIPAAVCESLVRSARKRGILSRLSLSPAGAAEMAFACVAASALAGLGAAAFMLLSALILGAPFFPGILLSLAGAVPECLFFSALGLAAGCLLPQSYARMLCVPAVFLCGIWLSHLVIVPSLLPEWLAEAVSVTPHAAFTSLIHYFYAGESAFPLRGAVISAGCLLAALLTAPAAMKKQMK